MDDVNAHSSRYCTDCLTATGTYEVLRILYIRVQKKFMKSGLFQCSACEVIAVSDGMYDRYRDANNHIIKKLTTVMD